MAMRQFSASRNKLTGSPPTQEVTDVNLRLTRHAASLAKFFSPPDEIGQWVSRAIVYYVDEYLSTDDAALSKMEAMIEEAKEILASAEKAVKASQQPRSAA